MSQSLNLKFIEADIYEKEILTFHIPRSKKLPDDHKYFDKRIIWTLIKWEDIEEYPYKAIEEDEKKGIRYQEIPEQIITEVHGISNTIIEEVINLETCFAFTYTPNEGDRLIVTSEYTYAEIKTIQQPYTRGFVYMSFTYKNEYWEIDTEILKRVIKNATKGIVEVTEIK
ncbi:hypothetical protein [Dokdonia sp.]|uniref:hypothetical protein n=1 Tax=Dokdonia sp. TaxID=2024995 RepID=UPI003265833B